MAIGQPLHLLTMADAADATTMANYGTAGTAYSFAQGANPTDYVFHPGAGSLDGYWEGKNASGTIAYATTTGTIANTLQNIAFACRFTLQSLNNGDGWFVTQAQANGLTVRGHTNGGNFDIRAYIKDTNFNNSLGELTVNASVLSFNTEYSVAVRFTNTTGGNYVLAGQVDAMTAQATSALDFSGSLLQTAQPRFGQPLDYTNLQGLDGYVAYWAYWVGANAPTTNTDLANINSNPKAYIPGFAAQVNRTNRRARYIVRR